jgi:hypothetical protein
LADSSGNLLGGASGTNYYFKFSLWTNSTVGGGTKVWPIAAPTSYQVNVRQGVFNVNIGDTANGYPDVLNYDFSRSDVYLQIEVSSNGTTFETLSPRQQISSSAFAQVAGAISGVGQSSIGTVTPDANSMLTVVATTTNSTAISIRGSASQTANLLISEIHSMRL